MKATINIDNGQKTLAAVIEGDVRIINDVHPNFDKVYEQVFVSQTMTESDILGLFDMAREVSRRFEALSERVTVSGGTVYFDGDPVHNALTEQVKRFMDEGLDFSALVHFFEKVMTNPNVHSQEQLFEWLSRHRFALTPTGDFIAYKGVATKGEDGVFYSISSGTAISDGVQVTGQIPQAINSTVEMPRSKVQFDPSVGCSYGLHAGTWSYASSFARGAVLTVIIDPRDVVSVPSDCDAQKLRVCRYRVSSVTPVEYEEALYDDFYDEFDDDDDFGLEDESHESLADAIFG